MGTEAAKEIRARQREAAARIDALVAHVDERAPDNRARRERINAAVRRGRSHERIHRAAMEAATASEIGFGTALEDLLRDGLTRNAAYELLGVTRAVGSRRLELAIRSTRPVATALSTDRPSARDLPAADLDGDNPTGRLEGAPIERKN